MTEQELIARLRSGGVQRLGAMGVELHDAAADTITALLARAEAAEARADAAEATVAEVTSDRAYIIGANAGWEAAVEQGEATPEAKSAMVRFWRRIAEQHLSHADAAEAALAAERETVARLTEALQKIDDEYGPNHLSKFARDTARAALTQKDRTDD